MSLSLDGIPASFQNRTVTEPRTRLAVAKPAPAGAVAAVPPKIHGLPLHVPGQQQQSPRTGFLPGLCPTLAMPAHSRGEAFQGDGPKVAAFEQTAGQPLCARRTVLVSRARFYRQRSVHYERSPFNQVLHSFEY